MFEPGLYSMIGGLKPLASPWQRLTLAFQHGFPGLPAPVHLGFSLVLLAVCAAPVERLVGPARFTLVTVCAMGAYAVAHLVPSVDGHGASGVIWAYAPILFVARRRRREEQPGRDAAVLTVMWVVVPVVMTLLVYASGYRGNPLTALVLANLFHISGTLVGVFFAMLWSRGILAPVSPAPHGRKCS